jgi:lipoprotein-releasing system permease protein
MACLGAFGFVFARIYSFSKWFDPDLKAKFKSKSFWYLQSKKINLNTAGIASFSKIIEERVLFVWWKTANSYLKGVDKQYTEVKASQKLFNGQWLKPDTYQVVIGYNWINYRWGYLI